MFTVMYALPATANGGGVLIPPPAFAQSSSLAQDIIDSAQQEADSSASGSNLNNNNEFGDDNIPIIDQDNTADQDAANVGLQDQDAAQEQDVEQDATQEDFDFDVQVGEAVQRSQQQPPPQTEPPPQCALEITADKEIYGPGDVVVITVTNTGDEPLDFPNSALGLQIKNVDTGEVFPLEAAQVITTLEPGESRTFEFTYEELVDEIGTGLISATVVSDCGGAEEVTFRLSVAPPEEDTTPPTLTVPEDFTAEATSPDGAVVTFEVTAEDNVDGTATLDENNRLIQDDVGGDITISCDPPSGSEFPVGETVVECTATDAAGNIGRASFTVTVNPVESPRENGKIAFTSGRDGNSEIYVMNADGTGQTRLTNNPAFEFSPTWSPDGTKIAFISGRDRGNPDIYVMNAADGSNVQRLTNNAADDYYYPDWSPDGSKIAFMTNRHGSVGNNEEIYVMNADGSGQRNLSNDPGQDLEPSWSPDGTEIVFYTLRDRQSEIYVMNADGSGQTRLTDNPAGDGSPDWGPATDTTD